MDNTPEFLQGIFPNPLQQNASKQSRAQSLASFIYSYSPKDTRENITFDECVEICQRLIDAGYKEESIISLAPMAINHGFEFALNHGQNLPISIYDGITKRECKKRMTTFTRDYPNLPQRISEALYHITGSISAKSPSPSEIPVISTDNSLKGILRHISKSSWLPKTISELYSAQKANIFNAYSDLFVPLITATDGFLTMLALDTKISDTTWITAIEITLYSIGYTYKDIVFWNKNEINIIANDLIDDCMPTIYAHGVLIHCLRNIITDQNLRNIYISRFDRNAKSNEMQLLKNELQELKGQNNALNNKVKEQKKTIAHMQSFLGTSSQKNQDISQINHKHNQQLREKDAEIEVLQRRIEQLESERMELERAAFLRAEQQEPEKPWLNTDLPDDGVVFLGGHENMVKKLRERYPRWTFLADESTQTVPTNVDIVYVWSGHLSHPLWKRVIDAIGSREKLLYVQATNLDRLKEEMQYELWNREKTQEK